MDEMALIREFVDLTGATESSARCVLMYLDVLEAHPPAEYVSSEKSTDAGQLLATQQIQDSLRPDSATDHH